MFTILLLDVSSGIILISCFFFFQAEDGIRDYKVTGVQTCALPISRERRGAPRGGPLLATARRRAGGAGGGDARRRRPLGRHPRGGRDLPARAGARARRAARPAAVPRVLGGGGGVGGPLARGARR